ncbi:MAG: hypothetical protein WCR46_03060 [Deltaproteobacteria bacterium]
MVTSGAILYVDFGSLGLYKRDGAAWTQLTSASPENMVTSGETLYVDFGASYPSYKTVMAVSPNGLPAPCWFP